LPEDKRQMMTKFFNSIKKLLAFDVGNLFKLADSDGNLEEAVIYDLYLDVLLEAVDDEDYSHMAGVRWNEPDPLDAAPMLKDPKLTVNAIFNTNYHKLVEIRVKTPDISFKGYVIDKINKPDTTIAKELKAKLLSVYPGDPPPFRWYRTTDDALREIEVIERGMTQTPSKKPALNKPANAYAPVVHPNPTRIEDLIKTTASHFDKNAANVISKLDRAQLTRVVAAGKEATKTMSIWDITKTIFLGYLALTALVTGASGLAAQVIGFLAVQGVNYLRKNKEQPQLRNRNTVKPIRTKDPLRIRNKVQ
jgi:hypothetical protein